MLIAPGCAVVMPLPACLNVQVFSLLSYPPRWSPAVALLAQAAERLLPQQQQQQQQGQDTACDTDGGAQVTAALLVCRQCLQALLVVRRHLQAPTCLPVI